MSKPIRPRMTRLTRALLCAACPALFAATASAQDTSPQPEEHDAANAVQPARGVTPPLGLPPGLAPQTRGDVDPARLNRSADDVLADIEPATFAADAPPDPDAELSPLAQRALDRAEGLMREGRTFDAIEGLLEAERLAPDHPRVARTLGLAYVRGGNHVLGSAYLRRAAGLAPADTEARAILARLALERGAWDEALSLAASVDQADAVADHPAARCVADYIRAVALDELGYALAAITLYERVLSAEVAPDAQSPAGRELYIIQEREADTRLRIGDLHLRRDETAFALAAYQRADVADVGDPAGLVLRRVYCQWVVGWADAAIDEAIAFLAGPQATEFDAALIGYLVEQGADPAALDAQLVAAQAQAPAGHFPLVAARAAVLPQAETVALIDAWLADQPARLDTFRRAISLLRGAGGAAQDDPQALARAFALTSNAMRREPRRADEYADALLSQDIDPVALIRAMRLPEVRDTQAPMLLRLCADGYLGVGRYEDAVVAYARALTHEPDDAQTQLDFARLLIQMGPRDAAMFDQAAALLGQVGSGDRWERFSAYIDYLRLSAHPGELPLQADAAERREHEREGRRHAINLSTAQQMIGKRLERHPNDLNLLLLQAQLLVEANYLPQAIELMDNILARFPTREEVYIASSSLYGSIQPGRNYDRDITLYIDFYFDRVLPRLSQYLPQSRTARMVEVNQLIDRSNTPELALPILEAMLQANPDDATAVDALMDVYTALGDTQRAQDARARWIELLPPGLGRVYERVKFAEARGDAERVAALVRETFALDAEGVLPGMPMTGEFATTLLNQLSLAVGHEAAEADYVAQLVRFPENAALNNSLGYQWTMANKELLAAEVMIRRAIEARPGVSSYLDSMGWVLYKLGRFDEAQQYMTEAIAQQRIEHRAFELREGEDDPRGASQAVLLDHLGDILYAQGDIAGARARWRTATGKVVSPRSAAMDPESASVIERCRAKLEALESGNTPPVSEVPGEAAYGSGIHPADRE